MKKGIFYAIGAYTVWGVLPIFWKLLQSASASEIVAHRMVWSLIFLAAILSYRRQWQWLPKIRRNRRAMGIFALTAALLGTNWLIYVWGVNTGHIVETSLGYFINPLVNVLFGVIFFHERLRRGQWLAIAIATAGVLYLTFSYGALPWIALSLAFSFGFYGMFKKKSPLNALEGLSLEMMVLFIPALLYLFYLQGAGEATFGHVGLMTTLLLAMTGVATAIPLLFFAAAAQRIPLSVIGVLQYLAPTLQFLIGVIIYGEAFTQTRLIGFGIIWLALFIYTVEGVVMRRKRNLAALDKAVPRR
ncbi:MAG TPA: EamA family transporter RarD [Chloroflexi bacterium]|nr:MAG: EamA family transporter [Anaerolineaceae bacterium 4572_5.2]HEY84290.1 EamA family transporter RarD [Chloroflexota bacterium]